jgi:hypothetical protein
MPPAPDNPPFSGRIDPRRRAATTSEKQSDNALGLVPPLLRFLVTPIPGFSAACG